MNKYFKFEPVATLSAAQSFASAVLLAAAFYFGIPAVTVGLLAGVLYAGFAVLSTFVRGAVTPNATLEQLKNLTPEEEHAFKVLDAAK